jgi:hypothetical protein
MFLSSFSGSYFEILLSNILYEMAKEKETNSFKLNPFMRPITPDCPEKTP